MGFREEEGLDVQLETVSFGIRYGQLGQGSLSVDEVLLQELLEVGKAICQLRGQSSHTGKLQEDTRRPLCSLLTLRHAQFHSSIDLHSSQIGTDEG